MSWLVLQSAVNRTGGTSISVPYSSNLSAGTKLIAAVVISAVSPSPPASVHDGAGNSFTQVSPGISTANQNTSLWAMDTPAGDVGTQPVITATFAGSYSAGILIQEVAGLAAGNDLASMVDGTPGTNSGTGGSSTGSPSYASSLAGEYLISVYGDDGGPETWTVPSGMTADPSSVNSSGAEDIAVAYGSSTGGAESASWGLTGTSADWNTILCAFRLNLGDPVVTVTQGGGTTPGMALSVIVLTGAIEAGGANLQAQHLPGAAQGTVTPNFSGSVICWAIANGSANAAWTLNSNNTDSATGYGDFADSTDGYRGTTGAYTGTVTSGAGVTVGASAPTANNTSIAAYEVHGSPVLSASTPAFNTSTTTGPPSVSSPAFTPPAGAVLVALVACNGTGSSLETLSISSTFPGLTWTQRAVSNTSGSSDSLSAVFTATVPSGAATVPSPSPVAPGLASPAAWHVPQPVPQQGDPQWTGPAPFPPGAESQLPLIPPGLWFPDGALGASPQAGDPGFTGPPPAPAGTGVPQFLDPSGPRPRALPRISRGTFSQPGQFSLTATQVPQFLDQAGSRPRYYPRPSRGSFQVPGLGQGNQGVRFPLFLRQASLSRLTLRRSPGRFFIPGQFTLTAPQLPSFLRQAASRRTLAVIRPARGQFFQQAWGQGNQGTPFPLYLRPAPLSRLTLRRSQGHWFSPGQFNETATQLPAFTRQPQSRRLALRHCQGQFFNQAWGQANQGTSFPLYTRQAASRRLALRFPRGQFFMQAWGQFIPPPPGTVSGIEQYPQVTPPFTSPASWWQPWIPPQDPGILPPPAPPPPQFLSRHVLPVIRVSRGKFAVPGQFSLTGNPYPSFTRATVRPVPERAPRGRFFTPGQFNETAPQLPSFPRQAAAPPRLALRRSQGKFFTPGQFGEIATQVPSFTRAGRRALLPAKHGAYFPVPAQQVPSWVSPWRVLPRREKLPASRRGKSFLLPLRQVTSPAYPPDFRTTRRVSFTRMDKARRGSILQLVPFQKGTGPELAFRLGVPQERWTAGDPEQDWRAGTVLTGWAPGNAETDWRIP